MADLSDVLTELADHLQYGAIKRSDMDGLAWNPFVDYGQPERPYLRSGFAESGRPLAETVVPDVFAAQLLGPRHSIPPLADPWLLRRVGTASVLLIHRELAERTDRGLPDQRIMDRARTELAPLLLTTDVANETKKAQWAMSAPPRWNPFI